MTAYHKILVPLDDTEIGQRALDLALRLAGLFEAGVVLLRVQPRPADLEAKQARKDLDAIEHSSRALLERARARAKALGLTVEDLEVEIRAGKVVDAIVEAAEETMADLVVMGTHGRQGLAQLLTGSNTERVLARTTASVLAVKPVGYPYLRDDDTAED